MNIINCFIFKHFIEKLKKKIIKFKFSFELFKNDARI